MRCNYSFLRTIPPHPVGKGTLPPNPVSHFRRSQSVTLGQGLKKGTAPNQKDLQNLHTG